MHHTLLRALTIIMSCTGCRWKLLVGECTFSWNADRTVTWNVSNGVLLQHGYWAWCRGPNCTTFCPQTPPPGTTPQDVTTLGNAIRNTHNPNDPTNQWCPMPGGIMPDKKNKTEPNKALCPRCRGVTAQELHDTRCFQIKGCGLSNPSGST